ncbi:hypothetical protein Tcan_05583 [Toxocara canis]|uniref:Uncharacterized protein n=1 Tax=Toxocara canis TaxID=6265 RepID=A0A0B2VXT9_TOXCA|nr:hypothetical protein Tcan_05583 [Toxocara canis]
MNSVVTSRMDSLPLGSMNDSVEFPNEQSRLAYRLNSKQRDDYKLLRKGTAVEREMKAWNTLKQNV